jgi:hypothetical protein
MSALYDLARQSFLSQSPSIDWDTDNIKVSLVRSSDYTPNLATDQFLGVSVPTRVADSGNLAGKSVTAGVADASDITFTAVGAGAAIQYLVIWKDTGVANTSPLIALIDTGTGLPVTPNGGDITVQWDGGADKIFKL